MESHNNPESQTSELEVGIAQPGDLTEQDISALAESLVTNTFDSLDVKWEKTRMGIKDAIQAVRSKAKIISKIADFVYPGYTRRDFIQGYQNRIRKLLANGELMIGKSNGRVVGIIGFYRSMEWEGREVYGTTKGTVLDEYRGKGYYTKIKNAAVQCLLENHPDCPIMTVTKNPAIIGHMRKYFPATQEILLGSDHPLAKELQHDIGEPEFSKMVSNGNVILWYDPLVA